MKTAAKKRNSLALGVIALMFAWVAACLVSAAAMASSVAPNRLDTPASRIGAGLPTTAPSIEPTAPTTPPNVVLVGPKTRAEVFGPFTANLTERSSESPVNSWRIYDPLDGVALECTVAPSKGEWLSDAMKGFRDGEIIPDSVLERLSSRLRNNTRIIKNEWAQEILEKTGDGAQFMRFKDGSAAILLRPNATRYQLVHELKHYEHWLADPAKYAKMGKLEREEFVFKALQESNHWRLFTDAERSHALELIKYYRKLYGN